MGTHEVGKATTGKQIDDDDEDIVEGFCLSRTTQGGNDQEAITEAWYCKVAEDGEKFWGIAQDSPDENGYVAAQHEGIVRAYPDSDDEEESGVVSLSKDDPVKIGVNAPGTVTLWTNADDADELIGYVETPVRSDDDENAIFIRLGVK